MALPPTVEAVGFHTTICMIINVIYDKSNKLKIYKQSIYIKFVYNANIVNIIRNSFTEKYYQ